MNINDINAMKKELDELKKKTQNLEAMITEAEKEVKPVFKRVNINESYYYVTTRTGEFQTEKEAEKFWRFDNTRYNDNNYFYTKNRAEEVVQKIKYLLKLERFYDMFCPDYKPNWNIRNIFKYYIAYDFTDHKYVWNSTCIKLNKCLTYFPTREIVEKICDILNNEKEAN